MMVVVAVDRVPVLAHHQLCLLLIEMLTQSYANSCLCKFMTQILFWLILIISSQFQAIKNVRSKGKKNYPKIIPSRDIEIIPSRDIE